MFKITEGNPPEKCLVIIQCDSSHLNGDLIACARYRIYDLRAKTDAMQTTHVLFIIHLPQQVASSSFLGFQGDPWIASHIDDLRPTPDNAISADEAIGLTISELFMGSPQAKSGEYNGENMVEDGREDRGHDDEMPNNSQDKEKATALKYHQDEGPSQGDVGWEHRRKEAHEQWVERGRIQESKEMETDDITSPQVKEPIGLTVDDQLQLECARASYDLLKLQDKGDAEEPVPLNRLVSSVKLSNRSPLFRRLHNCIQAAASRLKDSSTKRSTKRLEILVHLIPKEPPLIPGLQHGISCHYTSTHLVHF